MRFAAVHPFIGFAVGAKSAFNAFEEPERQPPLILARVTANRACKTFLRHSAVSFGNGFHEFSNKLPRVLPAALTPSDSPEFFPGNSLLGFPSAKIIL